MFRELVFHHRHLLWPVGATVDLLSLVQLSHLLDLALKELLILKIDMLVLHKVSLIDKILLHEFDLFLRVEVAIWHLILEYVEVERRDITLLLTGKKVLEVSLVTGWELAKALVNLL